eukprot:TRINITY_DN4019_c0_g1_i1.p1 TRINITY_DN4019_c0_g1~~TRINITY_DN4019_c0_g1_i1.p1  ORF type:complete len:180 (-),score=15.67 TRINITY_DN4019_c0_g1_i1:28-507(-)
MCIRDRGSILLLGPGMGWLLDKKSLYWNITLSCLFSLAGMLGIVLIDDPDNNLCIFFMLLWGPGLAGFFALMTFLLDRFSPAELRGNVHGFKSLFNLLGVVLVSNIGGYFFDAGYVSAQFYINIIAVAIILPSQILIAQYRKESVSKICPPDQLLNGEN